jgi:SAM-dependent methyltransferase
LIERHVGAHTDPFDTEPERYEDWFERYPATYRSELLAVDRLIARAGFNLEIGVGTGRFAEPFTIAVGLDPSLAMLSYARRRGVVAVCGVAEALPFRSGSFDQVLSVAAICFVNDPLAMLREMRRVLRPGGAVVIAFIDRASQLGRLYQTRKADSRFYRNAVFRSAAEIDGLLVSAGFGPRAWVQTVFETPLETAEIELPRPGYGEGGFVIVRAVRDALEPAQ